MATKVLYAIGLIDLLDEDVENAQGATIEKLDRDGTIFYTVTDRISATTTAHLEEEAALSYALTLAKGGDADNV